MAAVLMVGTAAEHCHGTAAARGNDDQVGDGEPP
jgi:hypothetical protein